MANGPFGGPRPFIRDKKTLLVLIGINEPAPPTRDRIEARKSVNRRINQALIDAGATISINKSTVELTVQSNPSSEQRQEFGQEIDHVQQYDIKTELDEISIDFAGRVHNTVVEELNKLNFDITGTSTMVV